ncbi:hypothetical protein D3C81_1899150 [compost metagenome]
MAEVDLELAGAQLRRDDVRVDPLRVGGFDHVAQHVAEPRQPFDVHVGLVVRVIAERVAGELRQPLLECPVEQVELQLERHHRANAAPFQALQHTGEHLPGLELDG